MNLNKTRITAKSKFLVVVFVMGFAVCNLLQLRAQTMPGSTPIPPTTCNKQRLFELLGELQTLTQKIRDTAMKDVLKNASVAYGNLWNLNGIDDAKCLTADQKKKIQDMLGKDPKFGTLNGLWKDLPGFEGLYGQILKFYQSQIVDRIDNILAKIEANQKKDPNYYCNDANFNALLKSVEDLATQVGKLLDLIKQLRDNTAYVNTTLKQTVLDMIAQFKKDNAGACNGSPSSSLKVTDPVINDLSSEIKRIGVLSAAN